MKKDTNLLSEKPEEKIAKLDQSQEISQNEIPKTPKSDETNHGTLQPLTSSKGSLVKNKDEKRRLEIKQETYRVSCCYGEKHKEDLIKRIHILDDRLQKTKFGLGWGDEEDEKKGKK